MTRIRPSSAAILALTMYLSAPVLIAETTTLTDQGWTVRAEPEKATLAVSHTLCGNLLEDAQLLLSGVNGSRQAGEWSVSSGPHQLSIVTQEPRTRWVFETGPDALKISSTSTDAVLTARVPAAADRMVARLIERGGTPVVWTGTGEVAGSYGGSYTRHPSALPARNPECMYFTLGAVSGSHFHGLFDRGSDTAIQFTEQTLLARDPAEPRWLRLTMPVPGNAVVRLIPEYYTKQLGLPFYVPMDDSHFAAAPMVWGSWTSCYGDVTESDIVRNTDWIADHLKPYGFRYVQLDDGYDTGGPHGHNWIDRWDTKKFPHGPRWLAGYVKSKGLHPGLWIVPNAYAGGAEQHPEWCLRDKSGKIILDYGTPALDCTHPEVQAFLKRMFTTLSEWGFEYFKFDGEHALPAYVPAVDRGKLHDPSVDPIAAYRGRLKLIRETIGPGVFLEGCPAGTPLNGIGYFNSYFNGQDVYNNWNGMHALLASINANAFLNHIVVYVMPGEGMELGPRMTVDEARRVRPRSVIDTARSREEPMTGFGVTAAEARTLVSCVSLSGVGYSLASVLPELPEERLQLIRRTLPTLPILPADLFSRGSDVEWATFKHVRADDYIHNFPEIFDLKVNAAAGVYDVVGLVNWRGDAVTKRLSFADKLGLDPSTPLVVFDFWNQQLLGVFKDRMDVEIPPHDTRVLHIHPLAARPQLIGNSRHITGAYSILEARWDGEKNALRGAAQTVPGEPYTLFFHLPEGLAAAVEAKAAGGGAVPVTQSRTGNCLAVQFAGRQEPIEWLISFSPAGR